MLRILKQYYPLRNAFFVLGEFLAIFLSIIVASHLFGKEVDVQGISNLLLIKSAVVTCVCVVFLYYNDLYDVNVTQNIVEMVIRLFQSIGIATIFLAGVYFVFPVISLKRDVYLLSIVIVLILLFFIRIGYAKILNYGIFNRKIMVLGSGELAQIILEAVVSRKDCGYEVECIALETIEDFDLFEKENNIKIFREKHEGLFEIANDLDIKMIVVALKEKRGSFPIKELLECRVGGIDIVRGNTFYEMLTGRLIVEHINPGWLIFSYGFRKSFFIRVLKRIFDVVLSLSMLIFVFPIVLITAIIIKLDSKGPIFYSQERVGEKRKIYKIHKFRSMVADAEKKSGPVWAGENDDRITKVGRIIRKTRIDELPQLWNVLKGEMSFVGPRPEREFFVNGLEYIIPYYGERFTVKPGITGWAQVCYPYGASVKDATEKLNYDLFYLKNMSLLMDLIIVFRTVKIVLFREGAR